MGGMIYMMSGGGGQTPPQSRVFYNDGFFGVADALEECATAGYRALSVPDFAEKRILAMRSDDPVWGSNFRTPSVKLTGMRPPTDKSKKGGTAIDIYEHTPASGNSGYVIGPANIIEAMGRGLSSTGAGALPEEFKRLLAMEDGERVFVADHNLLQRWPSGVYGIDTPTQEHMDAYGGKIGGVRMVAINHPQTLPFLGASRENAEKYLRVHNGFFGDRIGIYYRLSDLDEQGIPMGRLLALGLQYGRHDLNADARLDGSGRFLGEFAGIVQEPVTRHDGRPNGRILGFPGK
jgi:hypothetical protein